MQVGRKMQQGIFEPMFGTVPEDIEAEVQAFERASDEGRSRFDAMQEVAEMHARADQAERRQGMLLVERFVDELPETVEYMQSRCVEHLHRVASVIRDDAVDRTERALFMLAAKLVDKTMRERMQELETVARLGRHNGAGGNATTQAAETLLNEWVWKIRRVMDRLRGRPGPIETSFD